MALLPDFRFVLVQVGQAPVLLRKEIDGFAVNRVQAAIIAESWRLVQVSVRVRFPIVLLLKSRCNIYFLFTQKCLNLRDQLTNVIICHLKPSFNDLAVFLRYCSDISFLMMRLNFVRCTSLMDRRRTSVRKRSGRQSILNWSSMATHSVYGRNVTCSTTSRVVIFLHL